MRAAILQGPRRWRVSEVEDPVPGPGELLIRTEIAAICGSDVHLVGENQEPQRPGAPGHEAVGEVLESRDPRFAAGDRVLCVPPASTARCFADLQTLGGDSVVGLPHSATAADLVLAQQLGTAIFALKRFWPASMGPGNGHTAAVLGAGPAGLAFIQLLRRSGFEVVVASDTSPVRLAAAERLGARAVVRAPEEDALATALALTDGRGVDLVIEAAGRDATRHQAMRMVRVDGRIGLFGLEEQPGMAPIPFAEVFRRRPTIEMAWGAQLEAGLSSFVEAVEIIAGTPDAGATMVSHHLPLADIAAAFELAADPASGAIKVCLTFDPTAG